MLELFGILKLGRLLRLSKLIQFLNVEEDVKASMKLTNMVVFLVIYIHLYACTWWLIVKQDETWIPYADEAKIDMHMVYHSSISYKYLYSLLTSVQPILGGDIGPRTSL